MTKTDAQVDDWFKSCGLLHKEAMLLVRQIILKADPRIEESIKWKTPTFAFKGNIASFSPAKKFVSLMFHRGAEIPGEHPRLQGDGKLVRTMRFKDLAEVEQSQGEIEAVIHAWCAWKE